MNRKYFLVTILFINNAIYCQKIDIEAFRNKIKIEAESMADALVSKKFVAYIKYMHPILIEAYGGEDKVLETLNKGILNGAIIKSIKISDLSDTIVTKEEIQCTLKESIELETDKGTILTTSTLIGVSQDGGNKWYFIDASSNTLQELQSYFPTLSDRLSITSLSKPIIIEK